MSSKQSFYFILIIIVIGIFVCACAHKPKTTDQPVVQTDRENRQQTDLARPKEQPGGQRPALDEGKEEQKIDPKSWKTSDVSQKAEEEPGAPSILDRPETSSASPEFHYLRGYRLFQQKEYKSAADEFKKALEADPGDKDALAHFLESSYFAGIGMLQENKADEAYYTFKDISNVDPSYRETPKYLQLSKERVKDRHYAQGIDLYNQGRFEEALGEWQLVQKLDPDYKKVASYIERCSEAIRKVLEKRPAEVPLL